MRKLSTVFLGIFVMIFLAAVDYTTAQERAQVFKGATIIPVVGDPIENGIIVIQDGKITAVGAEDDVRIPRRSDEIDVSGKVIMPGLVDTHSHIGRGDGGDGSSATHPDVRILDAIDARSDTFKKARSGGVTTVNVMPGSGLLISGQTVYLKTRDGNTIYDLMIDDDRLQGVAGGIKFANGTNPIRSASPHPGTRAKSASLVRQLLIRAQEYKKQIDDADGDPEKMPSRNIELEPLVEVLEGKRIVHFHTHTHYDILTAIRIKEEFGFRLVLQHVSEGWKVADQIAAAGVPASIIALDTPGGKLEAVNLLYKVGVTLEEAGVDFAYHTDDGVTDSRLFLRMAALGMRAGLSREKALESLTIAGARMLDLDHRVGSLEVGKDADFLILSGDPFSVYTKVEQTWIDGVKVHDIEDPDDLKHFTGGYEVFQGNIHSHHSHD